MVEPCQDPRPDFTRQDSCLIAAEATLANGKTCAGFIRIGRTMNLVEAGPLTLFLNGQQCEIEASIPGWTGTRPVSALEKALLPIQWSVGITAAGESKPRSGSVSGARLIHFIKSTIRGLRLQ